MSDRDANERERKRREMKLKRRRQVMIQRAILLIGVLVICAGTGALFRQLGKSGREKNLVASGSSLAAVGTEVSGTAAETQERETVAFTVKRLEVPEIDALYGIYVKGTGWSRYLPDDSYCMAPAGNYVTAMRATLHNQPADMSGTIAYSVNLSGKGWLDWTEDAAEAGGSSGEQPLEAISMKLTGELAEYYDVMYSVLQDGAWTDWVNNGEEAGVSGAGFRVDGIRVSVVKKQENGTVYASNIDPTKPMVAVTYDDGPSKTNTPKILEILKANNARATFFMVGQQAEKNMDIVKQMVEQGCEVANHTYDHTMMSKVDPAELTRQLEATNQVVADASGVSPVLMRPCGGDRSEAGMNAVGSISMPAILWSIDTLDWKTRDANNTVKVVMEQVQDGDIILMHDLYDATAEASATLIPELVKQGYQLVTVSELASYRGGMLPGKTYSRFRPLAQ